MSRIFTLVLVVSFSAKIYAQIEVGTEAPELTLEGIYGKEGNEIPKIKSLRGKIIVLDFWATWCSPCVAAFPENNSMSQKYKDAVQFIGVTDDPKQRLENFLNKVKVDFWIGRDNDGQDFKNYKIQGRPQMYIINREGIIVYQGHWVTEQQIEEVIAKNSVSSKKTAVPVAVTTFGGFAPGEDPVYNAVSKMLGKKIAGSNKLIEQFIIRYSLENSLGGHGYRSDKSGYVGITFSGANLVTIFTELYKLPSTLWVENSTSDTSLYDVVYWRKAGDISTARKEIEQHLATDLSIRLDSVRKDVIVNVLKLGKASKDVKTEDEIEIGAQKAYTSISTFASVLENKAQEQYVVDEPLINFLVYNQGMEWKKMNDSDSKTIVDFLQNRGLKVEKERRSILVYKINNR